VTHLFERIREAAKLTDEEAAVLAEVRHLATNRLAERAAELDRSEAFPWENIHDLNALELNRMFIPTEYGGFGLSYLCFVLAVKEISRACASTAITWATTYHATGPVIEFAGPALRERVLPRVAAGGLGALAITEESGGSDATSMRTAFTERGDQVDIEGTKIFITNGDVADFIVVFGKWRGLGDSAAAITALVIEKGTPGLSVTSKEQKLGHRASSTVALRFEGCSVPRANVLAEPGHGRKVLFAALNRSRPSVAAQALGIAEAAFAEACKYANVRNAFGRPLIEFQTTQIALADLATRLALTESWLLHVARLIDAGADELVTEASILKLSAADLAMEAADRALQLHGGYGYVRGHVVERLFRDAKLTQIWEGTSEIQRLQISRAFRDPTGAQAIKW